jgi:SAM-dependent methyltransferase
VSTTLQSKADRTCPVCHSSRHKPFSDEKLDAAKIGEFAYASRKVPEFMCLRLVCCLDCNLVYAANPPDASFLSAAYADAAYDSSEEASCAAKSYAEALKPYLKLLPSRHGAVDVGAGSGPLIPHLSEMGFLPSIGIEPSRAAILAAPPLVRANLREGMFSVDMVADMKLSLICSFMTLEHMAEPGNFVRTAYHALEKGGAIAIVVHNRDGWLNKVLGKRSPIIDIEHLQLFNVESIRTLLERAGFRFIQVRPIVNTYPLRYWLRLTPLPAPLKQGIDLALKKFRVAGIQLPFPVGNLLAVGIKPGHDVKAT